MLGKKEKFEVREKQKKKHYMQNKTKNLHKI